MRKAPKDEIQEKVPKEEKQKKVKPAKEPKAPKEPKQKKEKAPKVKKEKGQKVAAVKEISFLPKEYIKAQQIRSYIQWAFILVLVESLVFVIAFVVPPYMQVAQMENEVAEIQLQTKDAKFAEVNALQQELISTKEQHTQWTDAYTTLNADTFITTSVLDSIISKVPMGVTINQLNMDGDNHGIKIDGTAKTKPQILNYVMVLQRLFGELNTSFQLTDVENPVTLETEVGYNINIDMTTYGVSEQVAAEGTEEGQIDSEGGN